MGRKGISFQWQAPELVDYENEPRSKESDVYAFSRVCYEIFTGTIPFFKLCYDSKVLVSVLSGDRPSKPSPSSRSWTSWGLTNNIWSMMEAYSREAPFQRPAMQDIVAQLE